MSNHPGHMHGTRQASSSQASCWPFKTKSGCPQGEPKEEQGIQQQHNMAAMDGNSDLLNSSKIEYIFNDLILMYYIS